MTTQTRTQKRFADLPYTIICISVYHSDLAAIDAIVEARKAAGDRRCSRSALVREWLARHKEEPAKGGAKCSQRKRPASSP